MFCQHAASVSHHTPQAMHFPNLEINPQTVIGCNVSEKKFSRSEIGKHGNRGLYVASDGSPLASIFSKQLKNLLEILSPKTYFSRIPSKPGRLGNRRIYKRVLQLSDIFEISKFFATSGSITSEPKIFQSCNFHFPALVNFIMPSILLFGPTGLMGCKYPLLSLYVLAMLKQHSSPHSPGSSQSLPRLPADNLPPQFQTRRLFHLHSWSFSNRPR
jgi:hypothetical protein